MKCLIFTTVTIKLRADMLVIDFAVLLLVKLVSIFTAM